MEKNYTKVSSIKTSIEKIFINNSRGLNICAVFSKPRVSEFKNFELSISKKKPINLRAKKYTALILHGLGTSKDSSKYLQLEE